MTDAATQLIVWLNTIANAVGGFVLAPIALLPGWLSATLIAIATGILLLIVFKYTSQQKAIRKVRDDITAQRLALVLFKDSAWVALQAQSRLLLGAIRLFVLALVPMAVMLMPVLLILGQLSLWYQQRPLQIGEEAVVTLRLNGDADSTWPTVNLLPTTAVQIDTGPIRIRSKREVCWNLTAREVGYHQLAFRVGDEIVDKQLAIGDGFMRVSVRRPSWSWSDALLHPSESPFSADSPVASIEIDYPSRDSWISGTDWWVGYWFAVSMLGALCFRRLLKVQI